MRFSTVLAGLSSIGASSAIITGFSVPNVIKPGDGFNLVINTANYIQSVQDVAVAFGVSPGSGHQGALGELVAEVTLGPSNSNVLQPITQWVTMPTGLANGSAVFTGAFYSLFGAALSPTITSWNVTIEIGDATSTTYVTSSP